MPGSISYSHVPAMNIWVGSGADNFTISSTSAVTNLYTGAGANVVYVTGINSATTINDQSTTDTVDVGWGLAQTYITATLPHRGPPHSLGRRRHEVLNVSNAAATAADTNDVLTSTTLSGLGMPGSITYTNLRPSTYVWAWGRTPSPPSNTDGL